MRLAALVLGLASLGLWLGWLARGRASGRTKRIAFRAMLLAAIALLAWMGPDLLAHRQIAYEVAVLLCGSIFLAYLYVVRFCPVCGGVAFLPGEGMEEPSADGPVEERLIDPLLRLERRFQKREHHLLGAGRNGLARRRGVAEGGHLVLQRGDGCAVMPLRLAARA